MTIETNIISTSMDKTEASQPRDLVDSLLERVRSTQLTKDSFERMGLSESDMSEIGTFVDGINLGSKNVPDFSGNVADKAFKMMENGNQECKLAALDEVGQEIVSLMNFAQEGRIAKVINNTPVVGPIVRRVVNPVKRFKKENETLVHNIKELISAVDNQTDSLERRVDNLDQAYDDIFENSLQISKNMITVKLIIEKANTEIERLKAEESNEYIALEIRELTDYVSRLETRLKNMITLYSAIFGTLNSLKETQGTAKALIDKFSNIKEIVAPIMVYQGFIAETNHKNQSALALANSIDTAVNNILVRNSENIKINAVKSIEASQRLSIRMDTVETVFKNLQDTRTSIKAIQLNSKKELNALSYQSNQIKQKLIN